MRAMSTIVAFLTCCLSVWAQETIRSADYYPMAVGIEWEYEEDASAATTTEKVTRIEEGLFVLEADDGVQTYWSSDAEGMRVHKFYVPDQEPEFQWSYFDPPITRFPHTMEAQVEYESRSMLDIPGLWDLTTYVQFNATFEGIEDHVVGERTYPLCAKVTARDASRSVFLEQEIVRAVTDTTEWWAWGIGPVEKRSHIVIWDIINGESEEWVSLKLKNCSLIESNPPNVQVIEPTTEHVCGTDAGSVSISGTATDDSRVMKIDWEDDHGHAGLATMNGDWQVTDIPLADGKNVITLTAWDSCGNSSSEVLTVFSICVTELSLALCHEGELLKGVQLSGSGLPEDAVVELHQDDQAIAATNVQVSNGGALLEFDMDLQNSGVCSWDLVIRHPSSVELARLSGCFQTSPLAVTEVDRTPGSEIAISWTSMIDRSYEVWVAPAMDGQWELAASIPSQGEATSWEDISAQDPSRRFYKVAPVPF